MKNYVFAYHGGSAPSSPEEAETVMAAWKTWFDGMGNAVVDGGNPVGISHTVTASGVEENGGANPLSGYSIVRAGSLADACEMAKGCPMVTDGSGSVEVAEVMEM